MFKDSAYKFLHVSLAALLVFALAFSASGVRVARAQVALSEGCAQLAFFHSIGPLGTDFAIGFAVFTYSAGETVSFTLGEPSTGDPQTVSLEEVNDNIVLDTTLFPGTVSYVIPSDGDYAFGFSLDQGSATWDVNCVAAPQAGPSFVVNANADTDDGICGILPDNDCTLREAINAANAQSGANTITFDTTGVFATPQTITLASTLPGITDADELTIDGSGADVTISGNNARQVIQVYSGATLTVKNLTVANGFSGEFDGGAMVNLGALMVINSTLSGNSASLYGGAIANLGALMVTNSTLSGNSASHGGGIVNEGGTATISNSTFSDNSAGGSYGGGAIYNYGTDTLTVTDSTFSNNTATGDSLTKDARGGAILIEGGTVNVLNSTFDGNTAEGFSAANPGNGYGGAIYAFMPVNITIANSTFSKNKAKGGDLPSCSSTACTGTNANGGAIYIQSGSGNSIVNSTFSVNVAQNGQNLTPTAPSVAGALFVAAGGSVNLKNSILANSVSPVGTDCFSNGTVNQTNNLIETQPALHPTCGVPAITSDPMLDTLADNGGTTLTMALQPGSPAIDAGDDATCAAAPVNNLDQRGETRPQGPHCDIGAYEAPDTTPPSVAIDQASGQADPATNSPINFTVVFSESVTGFDGTDVDLSASTAAGTLSAIVTGGPATYNVAVSGMTASGTVIASIPAAAAKDAAGNDNTASTSTDNSVTYVTSSPTTLFYNGAQVAGIGSSFQAGASLSSPSSACVSGQTISFSLDDNPTTSTVGDGPYSLGSVTTNSSGQATLPVNTTGWQEGIYMITASFGGTSSCDPSSDTVILTVAAPGNSATGGGWYTLSGSGRNNFGFNVRKVDSKCNANCAYKGQLLLMNNGKWKLKGTLNTYVKSSSGVGTAGGVGDLYWWDASLNGGLGDWALAKSGVTYTISFYDGGSGKKAKADTFGISIKYTPVSPQPNNLPNSGLTQLKGGDIKVQ